jgi:hypothetical protein
VIRSADAHDTLLVAAHSTGALITALWAQRRRAAKLLDGLFLNSPFFDLNLPGALRGLARHAAALGRRSPYRIVPRPTYPVYGHSLHVEHQGEWSYDLAWKPIGGFPVRFGWLAAVRAGQARLRAGLSIDVPILVACSDRSYRGPRWRELARRTDTVLDVADIVRWAPHLGRHVTVVRINGGLHDLTLSAPAVRARLFSEIDRWAAAYVAAGPPRPAAGPAEPRLARPTPVVRTQVGRTPEALNTDGRAPEARTQVGRTPEALNTDGRAPEARTPDGRAPEARTPDGRSPEARTPVRRVQAPRSRTPPTSAAGAPADRD